MVWACELTIVNNLESDAGSTVPQLCATLGAQKRRPSIPCLREADFPHLAAFGIELCPSPVASLAHPFERISVLMMRLSCMNLQRPRSTRGCCLLDNSSASFPRFSSPRFRLSRMQVSPSPLPKVQACL
jgi:hypothetical protein